MGLVKDPWITVQAVQKSGSRRREEPSRPSGARGCRLVEGLGDVKISSCLPRVVPHGRDTCGTRRPGGVRPTRVVRPALRTYVGERQPTGGGAPCIGEHLDLLDPPAVIQAVQRGEPEVVVVGPGQVPVVGELQLAGVGRGGVFHKIVGSNAGACCRSSCVLGTGGCVRPVVARVLRTSHALELILRPHHIHRCTTGRGHDHTVPAVPTISDLPPGNGNRPLVREEVQRPQSLRRVELQDDGRFHRDARLVIGLDSHSIRRPGLPEPVFDSASHCDGGWRPTVRGGAARGWGDGDLGAGGKGARGDDDRDTGVL
mmetsp:Transcript_55910/g.149001  ORF Transcript_55910/g.149001 Transcript_55910/m.149001 type:complete len:314 (-) Transcript_55910:1078-2019(-)